MGKRFIVVDLDVIRGTRHLQMQGADRVVIQEMIFADILKSPDKALYVPKLEKLVEKYKRRVCIAYGITNLEQMERSREAVNGFDWINPHMTERVRTHGGATFNWGSMEISEWASASRIACADFVDNCRLIGALLKEGMPELTKKFMSGPEERIRVIKGPPLGMLIPKASDPFYRDGEWTPLLSVFPDKFAVARWSRICCWYAFAFAGGQTKGFEHNYYDAFYAFTASYAGHLLTNDKGLKACVRALFPNVQILDQTK